MKTWQEEYKRKIISAEEAAKFVKSGDKVAFTTGREPFAIGLALAARKEELTGVKLKMSTPGYDFGWYDAGWQDSFEITLEFTSAITQEGLDDGRLDFNVGTLLPLSQVIDSDVLFTEIS